MTKTEARVRPAHGNLRARHWGSNHLASAFGLRCSRLLSSFVILVSSLSCASAQDALRAEKVGWARLKTPSPLWMRHSWSDPVLMRFFREHTNLNIDPTWYSADVDKLEGLSNYPFLFAQSIHEVESDRGLRNLGEWIRRGGFLLIDGCINPDTRPPVEVFIVQQKAALAHALPEARVALLPNDHEIYRSFFKFTGGPPHTSYSDEWGRHGLYAIQLGSRLAGIISTSGLQCGWDGRIYRPEHDIHSMQMLVNIYIYAMMGGE